MATIPGALSVHHHLRPRRGVLWEANCKHLFWKAPTRTMNPAAPQSIIDPQADPASAVVEYGVEFRTNVESFISREVVDAAGDYQPHE
jgi:hypothetical protein